MASHTSASASRQGLAHSRTASAATSARRSRSQAAASTRACARSAAVRRDQAGNACAAVRTAWSTSASVAFGAAATRLLARPYECDLTEHGIAVANLTIGVGQELGLDDAETALVMRAALFHDAGKLEIPHELLELPRRLRPREWALMRTHPERG